MASLLFKRAGDTIFGWNQLRYLVFSICLAAVSHSAGAQLSSTTSSPSFFNTEPGYVSFNHHILFELQPEGNLLGQDRSDLAKVRLQSAWDSNLSRGVESPPVSSVVTAADGPELIVNGQIILHVSSADAQAAGVPDSTLAQNWKNAVDHAFTSEIAEKSPEYFKTAVRKSSISIGLGLSVFIIVFYVGSRLKARRLWSLYLAIAFYVTHTVINLFPNLRTIAYQTWTGPARPFLIAIYVAVPAAAISRIWALVLHNIIPALPEHISSQDLIRRTNLRRRTLASVAEVTGVALVWVFAMVSAMSWYGFNPSSLLTSAGLISVAIGLIAQDSIRDVLAGIYILSDDRYGVGDLIKIGDYEGRVERFNLRMTQIRDASGRLISLSNRNTTEVANLTARWAQVDFRVGTSYYSDLGQALEVLQNVANDLAKEWPEKFLDAPEMVGVESFNDLNITLRLLVKTPPGDQSVVAHELRKRVKNAFDAEKIGMLNEQFKILNPDK